MSNGYVAWGYYIDGSGISYDIDLHGTKKGYKVWPHEPYNSNTTHHKAAQGDGKTDFDPDDHDIESYYEDHKDEFDSIDEAYDTFEDDESAWDDY